MLTSLWIKCFPSRKNISLTNSVSASNYKLTTKNFLIEINLRLYLSNICAAKFNHFTVKLKKNLSKFLVRCLNEDLLLRERE